MPSFDEELDRMIWLKREGKVDGQERCKLVFPRLEAQKRVTNTEGKTRLIVQLDTPETYSEFNAQFARYKEITGNPQVAYQIMLEQLEALSASEIHKRAFDGAENPSLGEA